MNTSNCVHAYSNTRLRIFHNTFRLSIFVLSRLGLDHSSLPKSLWLLPLLQKIPDLRVSWRTQECSALMCVCLRVFTDATGSKQVCSSPRIAPFTAGDTLSSVPMHTNMCTCILCTCEHVQTHNLFADVGTSAHQSPFARDVHGSGSKSNVGVLNCEPGYNYMPVLPGCLYIVSILLFLSACMLTRWYEELHIH